MRADLVTARTALAHAAWRGATEVTEEDVRVAARLALPHRRRRDPFDEPGLDQQALDEALDQARRDDPGPPPDDPGPAADDPGPAPEGPDGGGPEGGGPDGPEDPGPDGPGGGAPEPPAAESAVGGSPAGDGAGNGRPSGDGASRAAPPATAPFKARLLTVPGVGEGAPGRRSRARTAYGRVVRATATPARTGARAADLHLPATLLAAAPHQQARGRRRPGLGLHRDDLRHAVREGREANLVLFVVDASGSMAARRRMAAVSGAVVSLLRDAYQRRDKVGLVTFRAGAAELLLPPTNSVPTAVTRLGRLRTGGRTPLADALLLAGRVVEVERLRDPGRRPLVVLLTDGRATVPVRPGGEPVADALRAARLLDEAGVAGVVVDCEAGPVRLGLAGRVAAAAGAALVGVHELSADQVAGVVRAARAA
jgi:magnesium chelatase subunit D